VGKAECCAAALYALALYAADVAEGLLLLPAIAVFKSADISKSARFGGLLCQTKRCHKTVTPNPGF
jgi:hypothetical protein